MGDGRILKRVAAPRYAHTNDMYTVNHTDEEKVKKIHTHVKMITPKALTRHGIVGRSFSVPW